MADTIQAKADLLTSFPDNIVGSITPQEMRDLVVSVLGCYGGLEIVEGGTAQTVSGTPVKMTGFMADALSVGVTPDFANNEITIITDGVYDIEYAVCFSGSANDVFYIAPYVDDVAVGAPRIERKLGTGGDVGSAYMKDRLNLGAGEVVSFYVWSDTGGTTITPHQASFLLRRVG